MEGTINMAARRQVTNKLGDAYRKGSKAERGRILDRVVETTGMGRSTARRMLSGATLPDPKDQIDYRSNDREPYHWRITGHTIGAAATLLKVQPEAASGRPVVGVSRCAGDRG
jgi:hypothetical protein